MSIQAIPYSEVIAKKVKEGIRNGVSVKDIMASIQKYQNAPSSTATFYKLYGQDLADTKADIVGHCYGPAPPSYASLTSGGSMPRMR